MKSLTRLATLCLLVSMCSVTIGISESASKSVDLFNGKDLTGWKMTGGKGTQQWAVGKASLDPAASTKLHFESSGTELVSAQPGANLVSDENFGDCLLELEFMIPQASNSGVKMMSIYEIQILDSFGKTKVDSGDGGAIYKEFAPKVNACKKAGEWQKLIIEFHAPRFDASGKKVENAKFVKVLLNGQLVQENAEVAHGTNVSRNAKEHPTGPIFFQGDHGPVAFRNIRVARLN